MNLSDLLRTYGDERVQFQNLDGSIETIDYSAKKGTRITFRTEAAINPMDGTQKLGLVVWLDRAAVKDILAADKSEAGRALLSEKGDRA